MFLKLAEVVKKINHLSIPHKAIVKDNTDSLNLGRVKVTIVGLIEETDITKLPYVYPKNSYGLGGKINSSGFSVPEIGSELIVEFPFDDIYSGFYTGYWQSATTHQSDFDVNYPETYGWRDSKGNIIKINKSTGDVDIEHFSGSKLVMKNNGDIELTGIAKLTANITGDASITSPNVSVSGNLDTTGTVKLDQGGGKIVTTLHIDPFTGAPHPDGSSSCEAKL